MPSRRTPFQIQKVTGTNKQIFMKLTTGPSKYIHMWAPQQCRDKLDLNMCLLYPLRHKMPANYWPIRQTDSNSEVADSLIIPGQSDQQSQGYRWVLTGLDTDRTGLCFPGNRSKCLECYKRTREDSITSIWTADSHFFRPAMDRGISSPDSWV